MLLGLNSCTQDLTCMDFKEGIFYIPADEIADKRYTLIRKGNAQIEYTDGIEGGNPKYIVLEWINNCSYRSNYEHSKMELNDSEKFSVINNGIVIEKVDIKGNCMEYIATMTLSDGEEIKQSGKICKE